MKPKMTSLNGGSMHLQGLSEDSGPWRAQASPLTGPRRVLRPMPGGDRSRSFEEPPTGVAVAGAGSPLGTRGSPAPLSQLAQPPGLPGPPLPTSTSPPLRVSTAAAPLLAAVPPPAAATPPTAAAQPPLQEEEERREEELQEEEEQQEEEGWRAAAGRLLRLFCSSRCCVS
jgi:hypothetical protein